MAQAKGGGDKGLWCRAQLWGARSSGGLWCVGARLRHGSGMRLRAGLSADGGSGLLGLS